MSYPTWLIRFDAGPEIGLGHWYRCLALAEELKRQGETDVQLWTNPLAPSLMEIAQAKQIRVDSSDRWNDPDYLQARLRQVPSPVLVLDLMETSLELVRAAKTCAVVASIGGGGEGRNEVDVRIDGMIPRAGYTDGFRGGHLYVGPDYVILRPIFDAPPAAIVREKVERVLIALGGDAAGVGPVVARLIAELRPELFVDVMVGPLAAKRSTLPERVVCHRAVENPRPLMERADVALISGGMTGYELMRLGIPMLFLPQVPHQIVTSRAFEEAGVGFAFAGIANQPTDAISDWLRIAWERILPRSIRSSMSERGRALVDGGGLSRVVHILRQANTSSELHAQTGFPTKGAL